MQRERLVLGAMTGTSIDGIDLALVAVTGHGLAMHANLVSHRSAPLGDLAARLRAAAEQRPMSAGEFASLALDFGTFHAREARALLDATPGRPRPDLACIHGQTVFHRPPASWQLVNPHPIARALGCTVVTDLRGADLAAGGEGAPLTPLADWVAFRAPHARAILNLGGFANATLLPADDGTPAASQVAEIRGRDLCACNHVLDRAARVVLGRDYDADGAAAARGTPNAAAHAALAALLAPDAGGRSLGTGDETAAWVDVHARTCAPADLLATAAEAVGGAIGAALAAASVRDAIVAGGGARHARLLAAIARAAGIPVQPSDAAGVPVSIREAYDWAILGALAQDGIDPALPSVTRRAAREHAAAGCWTRPSPEPAEA
jgi:1,6-anhydro-N-acetylmuramate kinase